LLYICMFLNGLSCFVHVPMYPYRSRNAFCRTFHTRTVLVSEEVNRGCESPWLTHLIYFQEEKNNRRNTFEYRWIYETCGNSSYNTRSEKSSNQPRRTGVHTFAPPRYHSKKHAQPRTLLHDPPVVWMGRHSDIRIRRTPWWSTPIICQLHTNHFQNPTLHPLHNIRSQNRTLM